MSDALNKLEAALMDVDVALAEFSGSDPSATDACKALSRLHNFKSELALVMDQMSHIVSHAMADLPELVLDGGVRVEKKAAADRKAWRHQDLAFEIAGRLNEMAIDIDTGERLMSAEQMVVKLLDFVQPSYWRVKELNKLGINADKFCEVSEGKESIIVRKAK